MRTVLIVAAWLLGASMVAAAPRPMLSSTGPAADPAAWTEAQVFAQHLLLLATQVSEQYVRPVERKEVLYAALAGVYQAARMPVPADLRTRIQKAEAADLKAPPPDTADIAPAPLLPNVAPDSPGLAELILRARLEVHGAPSLQGQNVLFLACQAAARSLDPYTAAVLAEDQRHVAGLNQNYFGLGMELEDGTGAKVVVRTVLPGSPAQRAGVRPGDEVTHLGGKPLGELDAALVRTQLQQSPDLMREEFVIRSGPPSSADGEKIKCTLRRPGAKAPRVVSLTPARFHPEAVLGVARYDDHSWNYWLDRRRGIAQVRLGLLATGTSRELRDVLTALQGQDLRGLILDLRGCPGGYLNEATGVAELFLPAGVVATVKGRTEGERVYRSSGAGAFRDFPMVVLIAGETSGGAELIAAALQDHKRARVAGQRSLGKASVQTPLSPGAGVGMKLTSGTFLRPGGKNLHRFPDSSVADDWGVRPDPGLEMRLSADLGRQLKQWWLLQTLRPGPSREALPLDDPEADAQRQAALAALLNPPAHKVRAKGE